MTLDERLKEVERGLVCLVPKAIERLDRDNYKKFEEKLVRLEQLAQAAKELAEFYGNKENWVYATGPGPNDTITFDFIDIQEDIGGEKARAFLEKHFPK